MTHDCCKSDLDDLTNDDLAPILLAQAREMFDKGYGPLGNYSLGLLKIECRNRGLPIPPEVETMSREYEEKIRANAYNEVRGYLANGNLMRAAIRYGELQHVYFRAAGKGVTPKMPKSMKDLLEEIVSRKGEADEDTAKHISLMEHLWLKTHPQVFDTK